MVTEGCKCVLLIRFQSETSIQKYKYESLTFIKYCKRMLRQCSNRTPVSKPKQKKNFTGQVHPTEYNSNKYNQIKQNLTIQLPNNLFKISKTSL